LAKRQTVSAHVVQPSMNLFSNVIWINRWAPLYVCLLLEDGTTIFLGIFSLTDGFQSWPKFSNNTCRVEDKGNQDARLSHFVTTTPHFHHSFFSESQQHYGRKLNFKKPYKISVTK
jgi:hypothetical protein